jgi:hypothetical protein
MREITCKGAGARRWPDEIPELPAARAIIGAGAVAGALLGAALFWCLGNFWGPSGFWEGCGCAALGVLPGATLGAAATAIAVFVCYAVVIGLGALWELLRRVARLIMALAGRLR